MSSPTIANKTPAANATLYPKTVICFDVLDDVSLTTGSGLVQVWIGKLKQGGSLIGIGVTDYLDPATKETVHDGTSFLAPYTRSIRIPWGDVPGAGWRFQIRRDGDWSKFGTQPLVQVKAVDSAGNEAGAGFG